MDSFVEKNSRKEMRYFFLFKQLCEEIDYFSTIPFELFFYKIFDGFLHHVCSENPESDFIMDFYRDADDFVLLDLLAEHTNRLTQMMIYGENYKGEYNASKRTVELLQDEITARRGSTVTVTPYRKTFNRSSAAWQNR